MYILSICESSYRRYMLPIVNIWLRTVYSMHMCKLMRSTMEHLVTFIPFTYSPLSSFLIFFHIIIIIIFRLSFISKIFCPSTYFRLRSSFFFFLFSFLSCSLISLFSSLISSTSSKTFQKNSLHSLCTIFLPLPSPLIMNTIFEHVNLTGSSV